jgi:putative sterol carrier protein
VYVEEQAFGDRQWFRPASEQQRYQLQAKQHSPRLIKRPLSRLPVHLLLLNGCGFCRFLNSQQALDKRQDAFQADKAKGVHASYQWELSGPNGGEWWLSVNDGTYKMGRGKIDNPNVTFAASDEDWVAMSNKTLKVQWAYLTGRLKIQGSHSLVKKLDEIFH